MTKKSKNTMTIFGKTFPGYVFVIGIILVATLAFVGYNLVANELDRRKFAEIEETVDTLVDYIEDEYVVNNRVDSSLCYESSQKLQKGPTICKYSVELNIHNLDFTSLTAFIESKTDVVTGYSNFNNTLTDFWTDTNSFVCSLGQEDKIVLLECSDYARANYYPFSD